MGVIAQTNLWSDFYGSSWPASSPQCDDHDGEYDYLHFAKAGACAMSNQLTGDLGRWIPAMEAAFVSNAFYDQDKWHGIFDGNGGDAWVSTDDQDWLAKLGGQTPGHSLMWIDCCGDPEFDQDKGAWTNLNC